MGDSESESPAIAPWIMPNEAANLFYQNRKPTNDTERYLLGISGQLHRFTFGLGWSVLSILVAILAIITMIFHALSGP